MRHLLSAKKVADAKPKAKSYRLPDGDSLYLFVATTGVKSWQMRYRLNGKQQTFTLGRYPSRSLAEARTLAESSRPRLAQGLHLTVEKRRDKAIKAAEAANTFKLVAADWVKREAKRMKWSERHRLQVERAIKNHLAPLEPLPMRDVIAPVTGPLLRTVEASAPHMAEKVRRHLYAVVDHAVIGGILTGNTLPRSRRGATAPTRHYPAVTALEPLGAIMRAARSSDPCKGIARGHALLAFTAQRVGEIVPAQWVEFDLDAASWSVPRERMKRKDPQRGPHVVPLPPGLVAQLRDWRDADGSEAVYVCPAPRDPGKPITAEAIEKHYRNALSLGGKHSPHSWRSAFSTVCREAGRDGDVVEAQLDHVVGSKVASAYDRAARLELRRELVEWYEETLIAARDSAKVIAMERA